MAVPDNFSDKKRIATYPQKLTYYLQIRRLIRLKAIGVMRK